MPHGLLSNSPLIEINVIIMSQSILKQRNTEKYLMGMKMYCFYMDLVNQLHLDTNHID